MRVHPSSRLLTFAVGLLILILATPSQAQRMRGGRNQAMSPAARDYAYIEFRRQHHDLIDANQRLAGSGNAWRLNYQLTPRFYAFYLDGEVDMGAGIGKAGGTGYGLGMASGLAGGARVLLEVEAARTDEVAGSVLPARKSGKYYRIAYQAPVGGPSYLELAYVRGEFSGANSNRHEIGWFYRINVDWSFGAILGEDTDAGHDRTETGVLLRYHY